MEVFRVFTKMMVDGDEVLFLRPSYTRSPRQFTIPVLFTGRKVPLLFKSWFNIASTKTYNTFILFLFHEDIWCYKDMQSILLYLGRSRCLTGAWQVPMVSCHVWECPYISHWRSTPLKNSTSICTIKFKEIDDNKLFSPCKWQIGNTFHELSFATISYTHLRS